ncbi:hypothetical protein H8959_020489 [Pygathrix nigripes]
MLLVLTPNTERHWPRRPPRLHAGDSTLRRETSRFFPTRTRRPGTPGCGQRTSATPSPRVASLANPEKTTPRGCGEPGMLTGAGPARSPSRKRRR